MADWFEQLPIEGKKDDFKLPEIDWRKWSGIVLVVLAILLLLTFKPWFTVQPGEVGVVLRLGKYNRTVEPGFHFRLPRPVETVYMPNVELVRRVEVGFRTNPDNPSAPPQSIPVESEMLTGDENVIVAHLNLQYQISDAPKYLFNVFDVENTLTDVAESVERLVIGDNAIDAALTERRVDIQQQIKLTIQEICDRYGMGIRITLINLQKTHAPGKVEPAFQEVFDAREDKQRFIYEADGYRKSELPRAQGKVQQILQTAEAYHAKRIAEAQGEVERFSALLKAYRNAPEVTRQRLYLETLEKTLAGKFKIIVDDGGGTVKLLNLNAQSLMPPKPATTPTPSQDDLFQTSKRVSPR